MSSAEGCVRKKSPTAASKSILHVLLTTSPKLYTSSPVIAARLMSVASVNRSSSESVSTGVYEMYMSESR